MRIVFFGTPDFAVASLKAMIEDGRNVVAVVTAPDKPAGRGHKLQPSPVKQYAVSQGVPVLQPANLKEDGFVETLRSYQADVQIVVAFRMLPEVVWDMPPKGTFNVHASLLPEYRGAAPINWAIINGEQRTGVTTFKLQHAIDTGSILLQEAVEIGLNETVGELYERLMHKGAKLLLRSLDQLSTGDFQLKAQPQQISKHAPKIYKDDCRIDTSKTAKEVHDFIRGMSPFPGAFIEVEIDGGSAQRWKIIKTHAPAVKRVGTGLFGIDGKRLVLNASDAAIEVREIQVPGKPKMDALSFINGFKTQVLKAKEATHT